MQSPAQFHATRCRPWGLARVFCFRCLSLAQVLPVLTATSSQTPSRLSWSRGEDRQTSARTTRDLYVSTADPVLVLALAYHRLWRRRSGRGAGPSRAAAGALAATRIGIGTPSVSGNPRKVPWRHPACGRRSGAALAASDDPGRQSRRHRATATRNQPT